MTVDNSGQGTYGSVRLTPNFDGRNTYVGGASRIPNGNTTQQPGAWRRNYELGGPVPAGLAIDTPNGFNTLGTRDAHANRNPYADHDGDSDRHRHAGRMRTAASTGSTGG